MSYRALTGGHRAGDVRDVVGVGKQVAGALSNPVGAVLDFIGGQLFSGLFGTSEQDLSIMKFNKRFRDQLTKLAQRMAAAPRRTQLQILGRALKARRNPRLRR